MGDSFGRQYYASLLVMMEAGLMVGRIGNLMPTYLLISQNNYAGYFMVFGIVTLFMVPLYIASKKTQNITWPALKNASTDI